MTKIWKEDWSLAKSIHGSSNVKAVKTCKFASLIFSKLKDTKKI